MILIYNLLNNNFITHDLVYFWLFIEYANILVYWFITSYLNYGVFFIFFNLYIYALSKQFKFIKQYKKYFLVFRFLTMLIMLLKFIWTYDLLFYGLCISTVILLGFALVRYRRVVAVKACSISMFVSINSETNQIIVVPNQHTRAVSNVDFVSHRFEFTLPS
jgi:hypothetical protein